ncbi:MAG: malate dehydrogenase [Gammaproteobacteria bacterium]
MKIGIIGIGHVGSTLAYALVLKGLCQHLVLAGRNVTKAQGDALDLQHTLAFCERPIHIESSPIERVKDCDILVMTASAPLSGQLKTRIDLGPVNVTLFKQLIPELALNNPDAIFLIISNPIEVLTYLTHRLSGFSPSKILGIGTLVDSARFRASLSRMEKIHPNDLRAYILGEHGPNQFPVFSHATAGSEQIADTPPHRRIFEAVNSAGFEVLRLKGYTNYAIATAACEVIQAIVYDDHRTMPLCIYFDEWQGFQDNCFSIPVVVGREGVTRYLHPDLNPVEQAALATTAKLVRANIDQLLYPEDGEPRES